jgi:hypothetical protein
LVNRATAAVSSPLWSIYKRYFVKHVQLEHPASFEAFAGLSS